MAAGRGRGGRRRFELGGVANGWGGDKESAAPPRPMHPQPPPPRLKENARGCGRVVDGWGGGVEWKRGGEVGEE